MQTSNIPSKSKIKDIPVYCLYDEIISADKLKPNPQNPNKHPKEQIDMLAYIIKKQGWRNPITVSRQSGYIVKGHARYEAAKSIGNAAPVEYQDYQNKQSEYEDLIADNRIAELAVLDEDQITEILAEMLKENPDIDVKLSGYTEGQVKDFIEKQSDNGEKAAEQARLTLQQKFIIPPFSVLDARAGAWNERKKAWKSLGIKSEIGRGNDDDKTKGGLTFSQSSQPASTYKAKNDYEEKIGQKISWDEFAHLFPSEMAQNGTSMFDPVLCEVMYRWFCPQCGSILDPFAGGSVRGIVAALTGRRYIGVDISQRQINANKDNWHKIVNKSALTDDSGIKELAPDPRWICGDSMKIDKLVSGKFDFLFTCPPYADLEVYSDDPADISNKDYPEFLRCYCEIIKKSITLLKPNRFACIVVGEVRDKSGNYKNFVSDTIQAFLNAGMHYYNEIILIMPCGSLPIRTGKQFTKSRKVGKAHQNILMFNNGNLHESGLFDYSKPEYTEKDIKNYLAQREGKIGKVHNNVLVFSNGDPVQASSDIGTVETESDLTNIDNTVLLNNLLSDTKNANK